CAAALRDVARKGTMIDTHGRGSGNRRQAVAGHEHRAAVPVAGTGAWATATEGSVADECGVVYGDLDSGAGGNGAALTGSLKWVCGIAAKNIGGRIACEGAVIHFKDRTGIRRDGAAQAQQ